MITSIYLGSFLSLMYSVWQDGQQVRVVAVLVTQAVLEPRPRDPTIQALINHENMCVDGCLREYH